MKSEVNEVNNFLKKDLKSRMILKKPSLVVIAIGSLLFCSVIRDGATIMYAEVDNHLGTKIKGRVYDITGDVTDKYKRVPWESITDTAHRARITRDCIMF